MRARDDAEGVAKSIEDDVEKLLREHAKSPLLDPDPEAQARANERAARLEAMRVLYPGTWRGPRKTDQ